MRLGLRRFRRSFLTFNVFMLLLLVGTVFEVASVHSAYNRPRSERQELKAGNRKIFIASIHWNNEVILREHWIPAVVALVRHLGSENVFVSVQESGSWDRSKDALRTLDVQLDSLGVRRKIILDRTTHKDEISQTPSSTGWIRTSREQTELRRIPYLSRLRNLVMEPLAELAEQGEYFDKVLWIGDVVFDLDDVLNLVNTRDGGYAAACALDFAKPPSFYDTFALRDSEGHGAVAQTWPYFRSRKSRNAIKSGLPVPVASCWNGITSMDAKPLYNTTHPLRFRGVPDSLAEYHIEGSECCLIHLDNPQSPRKGVWLNPMVRVGYSSAAYEAVHPASCRTCLSVRTILFGLWNNRIRRWLTPLWFKISIVSRRLASWQAQDELNEENGAACLINEMQVLAENGWAHV